MNFVVINGSMGAFIDGAKEVLDKKEALSRVERGARRDGRLEQCTEWFEGAQVGDCLIVGPGTVVCCVVKSQNLGALRKQNEHS